MASVVGRVGRITAHIGLIAAATVLGGCYDDGYGYGGVGVGYGAGGYYNGYAPGYGYDGYGGYGGYAGYGWNNGFYYPGSGFYVYDRGGGRHRWNDSQRGYWQGRRGGGDRGYAGRGGPRDSQAWGSPQGQGDRGLGRPDRGAGRPDRSSVRPDGAAGLAGRGAWRDQQRGAQTGAAPAAGAQQPQGFRGGNPGGSFRGAGPGGGGRGGRGGARHP